MPRTLRLTILAACALTFVVGVATVGLLARSPAAGTTAHRSRTATSTTRASALATGTRTAPDPVSAVAAPTPPFAVGVTHVSYTDPSRGTAARGDTPPSDSRTIDVTIRYPVPGDPGADEAADVTAQAGSFPLVVFAHGFAVSAETYAVLEDQLASAGFVVAAPDFPLTSSALPGPAVEDDVATQAADVSFVISQLLDEQQVPAVLTGTISPTSVGVIGHSDGGVTMAAVAFDANVADPRVQAAVILSGAQADYGGSWFSTTSPALLAVHGTDDAVNPYESSQSLFDQATGPKMLVAVNGGSHLGPFTTDAVEPEVAAVIAAFLRAHLEADPTAAAQIDALANATGSLTVRGEG